MASLFVTQHSFFLSGMKPNPSHWKKKLVHWWYTAMTPNLSSCVIPLWDSVHILAIRYGTKPFLWLEEFNFSGYCQNILFHMFSHMWYLYIFSDVISVAKDRPSLNMLELAGSNHLESFGLELSGILRKRIFLLFCFDSFIA